MQQNEISVGRICRADRSNFSILFEGEEHNAKLRGIFFEKESPRPVVGDLVNFSKVDNSDWIIEEILPRKSVFRRADQSGHAIGFVKTMREQVMAANLDYVFILSSLNSNYNLSRIARYVSVISEGGATPVVILTKADLCDDIKPYVEEVSALSDNVRVHAISSYTGFGVSELKEYLTDGKVVALLGSSGVGKSTLVNLLAGREIMKTGSIRQKDDKGRHVTTARELFELDNGVLLIDTPGMRELGLIDAADGVKSTFSDIEELTKKCKFRNCTHRTEPGCAVNEALRSGELDARRWEMYVDMLSESRHNSSMKAIAIQRKRLNKLDNRRRG